MVTEKEIEELLEVAVAAGLDGLDWLAQFNYETIAREYNGIGPEWLPAAIRGRLTKYLSVFEPAAVIHDLRNYRADGSLLAFNFANDEFLHNCLRLADYTYGWWNWKRYRARAVAHALFEFVDGVGGWKAWEDATEKREKRESSLELGAERSVKCKV